ncbi:hypothetical protein AKJ16_DCAP13335 [Drosera capensis]
MGGRCWYIEAVREGFHQKEGGGSSNHLMIPGERKMHIGVVSTFNEGSGILSVDLVDGRSKTIDLKKHGIRFVLDKQKRPRA